MVIGNPWIPLGTFVLMHMKNSQSSSKCKRAVVFGILLHGFVVLAVLWIAR